MMYLAEHGIFRVTTDYPQVRVDALFSVCVYIVNIHKCDPP